MPANDIENAEGPVTEAQEDTKEEPPKINKVGVAAFVVAFALILLIGGLLNKNSNDDDVSSAVVSPTVAPAAGPTTSPSADMSNMYFNRVSSATVCTQIDSNCNTDQETVAEIVYASDDGMMLAYTDGAQNAIGFFDISDPANPVPAGIVDVGGESTSLIIKGNYVAVGVTTGSDFVNPSGELKIVDMTTKEIVASLDMEGQPDAVALSPDKTFIAVAIENERDEDLNDGLLPQLPAGFLQVVDCSAADPTAWTVTKVEMTGLDGVEYGTDPEPEYVSINANNVAVVTLQENNALVLVDLATASVTNSFSAGIATVTDVDTEEEDIINQSGSITVPREPDGVTWIGNDYIATADEGDLDGGSRGFTIFDTSGNVVYESGNFMDEMAIRLGHYNDGRSGNKGNEPENIVYSEFESMKLLFVGAERANLYFVYEVSDVTNPVFRQALPTGVGPEGAFAIPSRNLFVAAAEVDERENKMRSSIGIYELQLSDPIYPTMIAGDRADGKPIPFSALSALSFKDGMLYSVEDSFYKESRMFGIDPSSFPYTVSVEYKITDPSDVLSGAVSAEAAAVVLNDDKTVNLDLEGIEATDGGFWLCVEGRGTVNDVDRPIEFPNMVIFVNMVGEIQNVVLLPAEVDAGQLRFGLEGVAVEGDNVVVTFQRAWTALGDVEPRLGIYNTVSDSWKFVYYPLDAAESQNGGWVGLSDIASVGEGQFLIVERDNQYGFDAAIKKIYSVDLGDFSVADGTTITKSLVLDLMPTLASFGGAIVEKVEGIAIDDAGNVWINNDNDGVDDNAGEQLLLNLGPVV